MLHTVGNKGERGGEGTGPSDAQVMGPPRDGGDGELAPEAAWLRAGATLFPPADGPASLGSVVNYCA